MINYIVINSLLSEKHILCNIIRMLFLNITISFLIANSIIFPLTDLGSHTLIKYCCLGKIKIAGTLWYQIIKFSHFNT